MYSKEEALLIKKEFWTAFAEAYPRKWLLYNTKIKDVTFKFKSNGDKLEVDKSSIKVERDIDEIINEALRKYRKNK